MTTKEKQREAKPMSPEVRPAHRHCDYATRVQVHLAKQINKRIERDRTFFHALRRLGFTGQSGFGSLTARDAGVAFAAAVKREYGGKPTKRERALAIKRLIDKFDVALSDIEAAS